MKKFAKISLAAVMTMGLFACTDYVDKYESDYKEAYGDEEVFKANLDKATWEWAATCETGDWFWCAIRDGRVAGESVMGVKWERFISGNATLSFAGKDDNAYDFSTNVLPEDLTQLIRLNGGVSVKIESISDGTEAGIGISVDGFKVDESSAVVLAYGNEYPGAKLCLMDVDGSGDVKSEWCWALEQGSVTTQTFEYKDLKYSKGEKNLEEFIGEVDYLAVVLTEDASVSKGLTVVALGFSGDGLDIDYGESSSSVKGGASSSSVKSGASSSSTAKSSDSVKSSSSTKAGFLWKGSDKSNLVKTDFGSGSEWRYAVYGDAQIQVPAGNPYTLCNGKCGVVHFGERGSQSASVRFSLDSDTSLAFDVSAWQGLCVVYTTDQAASLHIISSNLQKGASAQLPKTAMNSYKIARIKWDEFTKASDAQAAVKKLDSIQIYFNGNPGESQFFNIYQIGDYDACNNVEAIKLDSAKFVSEPGDGGLAQLFDEGSEVRLYEIEDGRSLDKSGVFRVAQVGSSWNFAVSASTVPSQYVLSSVNGYYYNEKTGKKSDSKVTLNALNDLMVDKHVYINVLTHLEYERVLHLVKEETKKVKVAKSQAQAEILDAFYIDTTGFGGYSDSLDMFGTSDADAALLAISILLHGDRSATQFTELLQNIVNDIAEDGVWGDSATKVEIATWAAAQDLSKIRSNVEQLASGNVAPNFEKYIRNFVRNVLHSQVSWMYLNPLIEYDTFVDARDSLVYKTVKIGTQTWMAQNLNYVPKDSVGFCYNNETAMCNLYGRLYPWKVVKEVCPDGWHLPSTAEWQTLAESVGGLERGNNLKTSAGWLVPDDGPNGNGNNSSGFSALPAGGNYDGVFGGATIDVHFWSATEFGDQSAETFYLAQDYYWAEISSINRNVSAHPIRCVMDPLTGTMTDTRDGHVYKTIKIANQTWMAENLNYHYAALNKGGDSSSYCYENKPENCVTHGRLYLWSAAMDSAGKVNGFASGCGESSTCNVQEPFRGVCPSGWHLPSLTEWNELLTFLGASDSAGKQLKATTGWKNHNGDNNYGFNALASGLWDDYGKKFEYLGERTYFWSSTFDHGMESRRYLVMTSYDDGASLGYASSTGMSVRCVQGDGVIPSSSSTSSSSSEGNGSYYNSTAKTLTDYRDNQVYKTTTIGSQIWMAENLKYRYVKPTMELDSSSFCYGDVGTGDRGAANCSVYGRLYLWSAAIDSTGMASAATPKFCGDGTQCELTGTVRGICPDGWHLPSREEWRALVVYVDGSIAEYGASNVAGKKLKSTTRWNSGNGLDSYGFSGLPSGYRGPYSNGDKSIGEITFFWGSTQYSNANAWIMRLNDNADAAIVTSNDKDSRFPIRCLKD